VRALGLDPGAVRAVDRVRRQLRGLVRRDARGGGPSPARDDRDAALGMAVLAGYPDRVARRRGGGRDGDELLLSGGGTAGLADESGVRAARFLVAVDAEDRREGPRSVPRVRMASGISPDWLIDLFPEALRETTELTWNEAAERVETVSRITYDALAIHEDRRPGGDPRAASRLLAQAARARGVRAFGEGEEIDRFLARLAFAREAAPEAGLPVMGEAEVGAALEGLCEGRSSFAALREASLLQALRSRLDGRQAGLLESLAPDRVPLPGGRRAPVAYEPGKAPWLASRLQDFFGMVEGPRLAGGRVPLVLHLLAPNQRAVQVTTDLAGFWDRHYPAIRRELCRRYPRHTWPEDPRTAAPPSSGGRPR